MSEELRVEFKVAVCHRPEPKPKLAPEAKAERLRIDRAARRARNLALAHYIDGLVRSGEVADLAAVARMCGVSRARVSEVERMLEVSAAKQIALLECYATHGQQARPESTSASFSRPLDSHIA